MADRRRRPRRSPRLSSRACRGIFCCTPSASPRPPLRPAVVVVLGRACLPESFSGLAQPAVLPLSPRRLPRFLVGALSACSGRFLSPLCHPEHACPDLSHSYIGIPRSGSKGLCRFRLPSPRPLRERIIHHWQGQRSSRLLGGLSPLACPREHNRALLSTLFPRLSDETEWRLSSELAKSVNSFLNRHDENK